MCRPPRIIEVRCHPPFCGWIKCNIDGLSKPNGMAACGGLGLFRNYRGFVERLG